MELLAERRRRVEATARQYDLTLPERHDARRIGELAGRRTGSSIEYQDRKDYIPGDDLRAIDWRAYARSDRLTVKLYREEISPRVDLILDVSASMHTDEAKVLRTAEMAYFCQLMASKLHATLHVHALGERLLPLGHALDTLALEHPPHNDPLALLRPSSVARTGGIKIVVSDLLFPFDPAALVSLFAQADRLVLVQVLSAFEADPQPGEEIRLIDAETGEALEVVLDTKTVRGYRQRLERLNEELGRLLIARGGALARLQGETPWEDCLQTLGAADVIGV